MRIIFLTISSNLLSLRNIFEMALPPTRELDFRSVWSVREHASLSCHKQHVELNWFKSSTIVWWHIWKCWANEKMNDFGNVADQTAILKKSQAELALRSVEMEFLLHVRCCLVLHITTCHYFRQACVPAPRELNFGISRVIARSHFSEFPSFSCTWESSFWSFQATN